MKLHSIDHVPDNQQNYCAIIDYVKDPQSTHTFTMTPMAVNRPLTTVALILAINYNHFDLLQWCLDDGLAKWLYLQHVDVVQLLSIGQRLPPNLNHKIIAAFQMQHDWIFNKPIAYMCIAVHEGSVYHYPDDEDRRPSHIQAPADDARFVKNLLSDPNWDMHTNVASDIFFEMDDDDGTHLDVGGMPGMMKMVNTQIQRQFLRRPFLLPHDEADEKQKEIADAHYIDHVNNLANLFNNLGDG